jgi:hypothetical protein
MTRITILQMLVITTDDDGEEENTSETEVKLG